MTVVESLRTGAIPPLAHWGVTFRSSVFLVVTRHGRLPEHVPLHDPDLEQWRCMLLERKAVHGFVCGNRPFNGLFDCVPNLQLARIVRTWLSGGRTDSLKEALGNGHGRVSG